MVVEDWSHLSKTDRDGVELALSLFPDIPSQLGPGLHPRDMVIGWLTGKGISQRAAVIAYAHAASEQLLQGEGQRGSSPFPVRVEIE